jgi:putative transcriptional regulator
MKEPKRTRSPLTEALLETAEDMRRGGLLTKARHEKITMRLIGEARPPLAQPITGADIRALRERANMSQAVFARHLNVTASYVSQLERGAKQPAGAALALFNILRRKGVEGVM